MGTRGLLGLIVAGKRYARYNHSDSYPEGMGQDTVTLILGYTPEEWDEMVKILQEIVVGAKSISIHHKSIIADRSQCLKKAKENEQPDDDLYKRYRDIGYHRSKINGRMTGGVRRLEPLSEIFEDGVEGALDSGQLYLSQ